MGAYKKVLLVLGVALLLAFSLCAMGANPEFDGPWELIVQTEVKQPTRMAAFLNDKFGITGGFSGEGKAHYTTDGGNTWKMAESSGGCIYGVDIVDDQTVWVCGRVTGVSFKTPGGIRLSKDGGRTFEPRTSYSSIPDECPMCFLNTKIGWAYQGGILSATKDGGEVWDDIQLPKGVKQIKAVALRSEKEGYALDLSGVLYVTANGGRSWDTLQLPLDKYKGMRMPKLESASAAMRFLDKDNGLVVLALTGSQASRIVGFRTSDGGTTWKDEFVSEKMGAVYLSPDGSFITSTISRKIFVYKFKGK